MLLEKDQRYYNYQTNQYIQKICPFHRYACKHTGEFHPLYSDLINCKMYIWHASLHMHEFLIHPLYPLYMLIVTCKFYFDVYECMLTYAWKQDEIRCNLYNYTYINPQPIQSDSKAIESKLPFQLMLTM